MRCEHYTRCADGQLDCQEEAAFLVVFQAIGRGTASSELACFRHHDAATKRGLFGFKSPMLIVLPVGAP